MQYRNRLATNLRSESEAYGFTLSIWGSGALFIEAFGTPQSTTVFLFVTGALLSYSTLAVVAFGSPLSDESDVDDVNKQLSAVSIVHVTSTLGNLLLARLLIGGLTALGVGTWLAALLVGYQVCSTYNLLLLLETRVASAVGVASPE